MRSSLAALLLTPKKSAKRLSWRWVAQRLCGG
jgi:hypothetical protein